MVTNMVGKNAEAYVDNMIAKFIKTTSHVSDLSNVFNVLCRYGMKLNLAKCTFGVQSGKFLGYMIT